MKKIRLTNGRMTPESLSNICFMGCCDAIELSVALRHSKTANELLNTAKKLTRLEWSLYDELDDEVILKYVDVLGNKKYLIGYKD